VRAPLYDVRWPLAVVLERGAKGVKVGLADGRIVPLNAWNAATRAKLQPYDVVHVRLREGKAAAADLRAKPSVQGAAVVLENRTGRILALSGGFSYPASQLNRVTQAVRQPGSTFKPFTYLAALSAGLQPNTLVLDAPVTLPPIGGAGDSWSPRNYDRGASGAITLRRALEHSKNLVTARLLDGAFADSAPKSLDAVCALALEAQLYAACERYYPFVLGAQPVRMIDLAAFYAAIANEGARPQPYVLESVEEGKRVLYRREAKPAAAIGSADKVAFYQLRTILQGVVARGTAASLGRYSAYLGGKTGTTENENDAWFVGFTGDVTIAVWVGYDNADGTRRTLGRGQTGGKTALPIFGEILQAAWRNGVPKVALGPPSPETRRLIADLPVDPRSGARVQGGGFIEHFRVSGGQVADTQYRLVPRETLYAGYPDASGDGDDAAVDPMDPWGQPLPRRRVDPRADPWADGSAPRSPYGQYGSPQPYNPQPYNPYVDRRRSAEMPWWEQDRSPRRRDPDYFWNDGTD
jgi:penicillin-binding protein 1A